MEWNSKYICNSSMDPTFKVHKTNEPIIPTHIWFGPLIGNFNENQNNLSTTVFHI